MPEKAEFVVGVFAGIINVVTGQILLRRRSAGEGSIIPGKSYTGNWELPGGAAMETAAIKIPYDYLSRELESRLEEELGIHLDIPKMPTFYPMPLKGRNKEGEDYYDLALVTPLFVGDNFKPQREICWVYTTELNQLARDFVAANEKDGIDGKGLNSGWGKRMHCMALAILSEHDLADADLARSTLEEIQKGW